MLLTTGTICVILSGRRIKLRLLSYEKKINEEISEAAGEKKKKQKFRVEATLWETHAKRSCILLSAIDSYRSVSCHALFRKYKKKNGNEEDGHYARRWIHDSVTFLQTIKESRVSYIIRLLRKCAAMTIYKNMTVI